MMTRLLMTVAATLALSVSIASAQNSARHGNTNARPIYNQLMTYSYGPLPLILGVAY